uniref:Phospholipase A2-like central domain-containing protein n=1 Tax=Periophthalmus magnuspinnatus TaxID=409849 RepID=A0A3B4B703_9GOBI
MQVRWVAFIHNVIALQTLVKCKLQNVMEPGTISCLTESYFGQGRTQVMFLREERGLLLYVTLWSEDMRLLACQVMSNPLVIENYRASYNRSSGENEPLSVVLSPNAPCGKTDAPKGERSRAGGEAKGRTKRSWLFPGTLWCGSGSKALGYDELGMFEGADRCCREHDHCPHIIPGFTVDYGVFNPNFFSVSHCDCDQRFRQCLLDVNDTISSMVHYSFFKILKVPCIELKLQTRCTEMYWWGMCKVTQEAPYAIFKRPIYYNTSFTSKYKKSDSSKSAVSEGHQLTEVHETEPSKKKPRQEEKCLSKDPPRGDTFVHKKTNGCRQKSGKLSTVAPYLHTTLLNTDISKTKALKTFLKHLDECNYKIPPLKKRFGLKNLDTKPAYHCACTRRLAREIKKLKQSVVLSFLEDSVSENCFKRPKRKKCHHKKRFVTLMQSLLVVMRGERCYRQMFPKYIVY